MKTKVVCRITQRDVSRRLKVVGEEMKPGKLF